MSLETKFRLALLSALCAFAPQLLANSSINMPIGVTEISQKIYQLHMIIFWICVAIGVLVFGLMFYAIIFHRKSAGHTPAKFHDNTRLEIFWSIVPFIILVAMAIPATRTILQMDDIEDSDLTVKVTGYMWRWHYAYLDKNIEFMSDLSTPYEQTVNREAPGEHYLREVNNPLVLPINKKIRFLMTGNDVIHSWWVPDLGVKKDAVPGFINETWTRILEAGIYRGQCAELCGARHGYMPIVVKAVSEQEFDAWVAEQQQQQQAQPQPAVQPQGSQPPPVQQENAT